jgi:hypothetical protein
VAEHEGRLVLDQPLELAVAGHLVQRVDARGAHPDEDVASSHDGLGHVGGARTVLAVLLDDVSLHDRGPLGSVLSAIEEVQGCRDEFCVVLGRIRA